MSEEDFKKGARSWNGTRIDDSLNFNINIKWAIQLLCLVSFITMGYYRIETKIRDLERTVSESSETISDLLAAHEIMEAQEIQALEDRVSYFEKELDINPLSWIRKKKGKKK